MFIQSTHPSRSGCWVSSIVNLRKPLWTRPSLFWNWRSLLDHLYEMHFSNGIPILDSGFRSDQMDNLSEVSVHVDKERRPV